MQHAMKSKPAFRWQLTTPTSTRGVPDRGGDGLPNPPVAGYGRGRYLSERPVERTPTRRPPRHQPT